MLEKINNDAARIRSRRNSLGDEKTEAQFRQDEEHDMDKAHVEALLTDRGLLLVRAQDNIYWTTKAK